ncbi:MAG: type IV pilus assembly protein PilM [Candidatus Omnitrophica bacterium]|nr:type IV pilus assembly protein PilM [Candidatus Omnitrophota bacterium]
MADTFKQLSKKLNQEINLLEPGQKLVGIDVGTGLIKAVALKETAVGTRLLGLALAEIPPAKEGETKAESDIRIGEALREVCGQLNMRIKRVNIIYNGASLNIKNINLPAMPDEELRESVKWEMEQNINFPVEEASMDFLVSGETIRSGTKNLEMEVVCGRLKEIKEDTAFYKSVNLEVESITIAPFCLWNVFQKSNQWKEDDTIALIDMGAQKTKISIFSNNILRFNREIIFGSDSLTRALSEQLNISIHEVEKIKVAHGLNNTSAYYEKIAELLKQFTAQIERSFGYYKAQFHIERINRIVIYGGGTILSNLDKFLSEELGIFVEIGNPLNGLLFDTKAIENINEFSTLFSLSIGAALNSGAVKRINLLPVEFRKDTSLQVKKTTIRVIPAVALVMMLLIYLFLIKSEKVLSQEKVEKEKIISEWKSEQELHRRFDFLTSPKIVNKSWVDILEGISSVIPENVWLNSITLNDSQKILILNGAGKQSILIIEFVRKLESLPLLSSVKLESVEEKGEKNMPHIYFKIKAEKK